MLQERKVVQILQRHEAIKEKDLNPWDLVIKEIIDDFQLNNFFIVDQGIYGEELKRPVEIIGFCLWRQEM